MNVIPSHLLPEKDASWILLLVGIEILFFEYTSVNVLFGWNSFFFNGKNNLNITMANPMLQA
jgi:hypothetical protein